MEIVRDFVQALAGSGGDFVTAREYLTGEAEREWSPETRTLIFRGSVQVTDPNGSPGTPRAADAESTVGAAVVEAEGAEPAPTATAEPTAESTLPPVEDGDTVLRLRASAWAEVGRLGHYRELPGPQDVTSEVILRRDDGEWRIRHLDPGFGRWLATADFERLFDPYAVHYVSTGERVLVPDIRYVPTDRVATRLAQLQLDETPDYLLGAVRHDIPASARLNVGAVPVLGGVATVDLQGENIGSDPTSRENLWAQFLATLTQVRGVDEVDITLEGNPLEIAGIERVRSLADLRFTQPASPPRVPDPSGFDTLRGPCAAFPSRCCSPPRSRSRPPPPPRAAPTRRPARSPRRAPRRAAGVRPPAASRRPARSRVSAASRRPRSPRWRPGAAAPPEPRSARRCGSPS